MTFFERFTRSDFENSAKGKGKGKGYHESNDCWLQFYHLFRVASLYRGKNYQFCNEGGCMA